MSSSLQKKCRQLQKLTGMSYQAAMNQIRNRPDVAIEELAKRHRAVNSLLKQKSSEEEE